MAINIITPIASSHISIIMEPALVTNVDQLETYINLIVFVLPYPEGLRIQDDMKTPFQQ